MFFERQRQRPKELISAIDAQRAIEGMRELDRFSGIAATAGPGRQGDGVRSQSDGVIGGDDALIVQAEAAGKIKAARQGADVASGVGGGTGEVLVGIGAEAGEYGVSFGQSGGASQTKFADQTILTSAPGTLDAAFGLGQVGGDLLDAELVEGASELGAGLLFRRVVRPRSILKHLQRWGTFLAAETRKWYCLQITP